MVKIDGINDICIIQYYKLYILIAVSKTRSCNYSLEGPDDER